MAGHFLTVVIQLFAANLDLDAPRLEAVGDPLQQALHFGVTLFHRQLEVDHGFAAMPLANPFFEHRGVTRRFFDDVAHHPVHRLLGLEGETVGHQVLHQPGIHQAFGHRAVVDGGHQHAPIDQLPGPATGRSAQIDAGHVAMQALVPLVARDEMVPRLFQLQCRAAWRLAGEFQTWNAHRPHRRVVRLCQAHEHFTTAFEGQQQTRLVGVFHQFPGCHQRLAQVDFEFLAEIRQFLAIVGIDHLQPQAAAQRKVGHMGEDHADAIGFRQIDEDPPGPLARENQLIETLTAHQPFGAVFFGADEFGAGAGGLGLGITGHVQPRGEVGNLGTDFAFEARPAVHKEGVHSYSWADGETFNHCAMPRLALKQSLSRKPAHDN